MKLQNAECGINRILTSLPTWPRRLASAPVFKERQATPNALENTGDGLCDKRARNPLSWVTSFAAMTTLAMSNNFGRFS